MACTALHNLCIPENDSCKPRWQLEVYEERKVEFESDENLELAVDEPLI